MVNAAFLLALVLRKKAIKKRVVRFWLLLAAPAAIAAALHLTSQSFPLETFKLCAIWTFSTAHLIVGTPRDELDTVQLLKGLSAGILINCAIAAVQVLTVPSGTYPLWSLYGYNQAEADSMGMFQRGAGLFGVRVWGLFAEPADMTASIGPWWLLLLGLRLGIAQGGAALGRFRLSVFYSAALFGGAALVMLSRSGQAFAVAVGSAVLMTAAIYKRLARRRRKTPVALIMGVIVMLSAGLYDLWKRVQDVDLWARGMPFSWEQRQVSLTESLRLWESSSTAEFLFGTGYNGPAQLEYNTGYHVWSVVVKSILLFGLTAAIGWVVFAIGVARGVAGGGSKLMAVVFALVCATGIAFAAASEGLVSSWLALGLLLCWRRTFKASRQPRWVRLVPEPSPDLAMAES